MTSGEITIKKEDIENGPGFEPDIMWFVDCEGYSFGTFETYQAAHVKAKWLEEQFHEYGWTPREVYQGLSGSTEIAEAR